MGKKKTPSAGGCGSIKAGGVARSIKFHLIRALKADIHRHVEKVVDKDVDNCCKCSIETIKHRNAPHLSSNKYE
jgi:hypothetical protein